MNAYLNITPQSDADTFPDLLKVCVLYGERKALVSELLYEPSASAKRCGGPDFFIVKFYGPHAYEIMQKAPPFQGQGDHLAKLYPQWDEQANPTMAEQHLSIQYYANDTPDSPMVRQTSSNVCLTHLPTGIVVCCEYSRSRFKNVEEGKSLLCSYIHSLGAACV
ncbi:peptide chain release factor-like protein [Hahella aquimaris]|uniref:peptide chain release factor family protein n=1 Tax=Hahella sp. HNIBRBA332 TaxID=3015983 RepID=UPI00273BCE7C|nr:peptide chain release factor-like protein [Hahella sp. HNIBRBA332]WLQ13959.1 peptide chain release factor-like protein [Hahella sp. HNIBRBA332]